MKKSAIFLLIGFLLLIIAVVFFIFAINHSYLPSPLPLNATYMIYIIYLFIMVSMFILSVFFRNK